MSTLQDLRQYTNDVFDICKARLPEKETLERLSEVEVSQIIFAAAFQGCTPLEAAVRIAEAAGVEMRSIQ